MLEFIIFQLLIPADITILYRFNGAPLFRQ